MELLTLIEFKGDEVEFEIKLKCNLKKIHKSI